MSGKGYWIALILKFLAGQGAVQAINLITGLVIIRLLPVSEYALYTLAGLFLVIGSTGSDFGISQAVNTMGAKIKNDRQLLGSLYESAYRYRRILFPAAVIVILLVATYTLHDKAWPFEVVVSVIVLVILSSWVQQPIALKKSILNINHDAEGLVKVGLFEACTRLLAIVLCVVWPTAITAVAVNFLGVIVARHWLTIRCAIYIASSSLPDEVQSKALRLFVIPLVPAVVYFILQGQISVFLLSLYGMTASIAEVGALGRLGQLVGLLMMLNPFFIQPYFARISQKSLYTKRLFLVVILLFGLCMLIMVSVYWFPKWWLFLLGETYSRLAKELPIAVFASLLSLIGATFYTIVIARNATHGQSWYIVFGLASQILFVNLVGVKTTFDALVLNALPSFVYTMLQTLLLIRTVHTWNN